MAVLTALPSDCPGVKDHCCTAAAASRTEGRVGGADHAHAAQHVGDILAASAGRDLALLVSARSDVKAHMQQRKEA